MGEVSAKGRVSPLVWVSLTSLLCASILIAQPALAGGHGPSTTPDVKVDNIWWTGLYDSSSNLYSATSENEPTITSGQPFTVWAHVYTCNKYPVTNVKVILKIDGVEWQEVKYVTLAGNIDPVNSKADISWNHVYASGVSFQWPVTFQVVVDPENALKETDETNNAWSEITQITPARYTLAFYMCADSQSMYELQYDHERDLEESMLDNFLKLASDGAGSTHDLSIACLLDMYDGWIEDDESGSIGYYGAHYDGWTDAKTYFVKEGTDPKMAQDIPSNYLPEALTLGEKNLGSQSTLEEFGKWAFSRFKSDYQILVMLGYGEGWLGVCADTHLQSGQAGFDVLTMDELSMALRNIVLSMPTKIDILAMDSCFMAQLEVVSSIQESADVFIGHQGSEPDYNLFPEYYRDAHNWPYDAIVQGINGYGGPIPEDYDTDGNLVISPAELTAWITVESGAYYEYYKAIWPEGGGPGRFCSGPKSIVGLKTIDVWQDLRLSVNNLADALIMKISSDPSYRNTIQSARQWEIQLNDWMAIDRSGPIDERMHRYADLVGFALSLRSYDSDNTIKQLCSDVYYSWTRCAAVNDLPSYCMIGYTPAPWIGVYWPEVLTIDTEPSDALKQELMAYSNTPYSAMSSWDEFLSVFYEVADNPPTAPGVPNLVQYFDSFDGSYTLTWQPAEDTDFSGIAEYRVSEMDFDFPAWQQVWSGSSNSCTLTYRSPGTYSYMVRAVDTQGNEGPWSGVSDPVVVPWDIPLTNSLWNPSGPSDTSQTPVAAPAIAADASGFYHVVWVDSRDDNYEIYYRKADDSWSVYGKQPFRISTGAGDSISPRIAVTSTGVIKVVWADSRSSSPLHGIWSRTFSQGEWGPETEIFVMRGFDLREPDVVVDTADKFHYIYRAVQRDSPRELEHNRIYYSDESLGSVQIYKYSGFCDRDLTPQSFPLPVNMLRSARLAVEYYSGERHVVFVQGPLLYESGSSTLYYLRYFAGKWEQPRVVVSSDSCSEPFRYMMRCDIAVDGYGRLFAVCDTSETWLGATVLTCHISDDNGNSWSRVFDYFVSSLSNVEVSVDSHGGVYLACDCKIPPFFIRHQVFCAVSFDFGITWSGLWEWESQVSYPPIIGESRWPCLCVNPKSGAVGLAWFDTRDGLNAIYFAAKCIN